MPQNTDNAAGMSVLGLKRRLAGKADRVELGNVLARDLQEADGKGSKTATLRLRGAGVPVYPRTLAGCVMFPGGGSLEDALGAQSVLAECFEAWFGCPPDARAVRVYREWDHANPGSTVGKYQGDLELKYFPSVDWSKVSNTRKMFFGCSNLKYVAAPIDMPVSCDAFDMFGECRNLTELPDISIPKAYNIAWMCGQCSALKKVGVFDTAGAGVMCNMFEDCKELVLIAGLDTSSATNLDSLFIGCRKLTEVPELDVGKATTMKDMFCDCASLRVIRLKGFGTAAENADGVFKNATLLGEGGEENRQSLVDTLLTDSFDRAAAGMPALTLRYFPAAVRNRLTAGERAAIEAKGYRFA